MPFLGFGFMDDEGSRVFFHYTEVSGADQGEGPLDIEVGATFTFVMGTRSHRGVMKDVALSVKRCDGHPVRRMPKRVVECKDKERPTGE